MRGRAAGLLVLLLLMGACAAVQSKDKGPQLRTVVGQVVDKDENPIANAVIYLENMATTSVDSHFSDDSGNYEYDGLSPDVDYQIYAEHNGMISVTHTISSFDSRISVNLELRVDQAKPAK